MMFLGGLTFAPYNILAATAQQRLVPDHHRGKVYGVMQSVTSVGLRPISRWLARQRNWSRCNHFRWWNSHGSVRNCGCITSWSVANGGHEPKPRRILAYQGLIG